MRGSEREGYRGHQGEVPVKKPSGGEFLRIRTEERLGSLISAVGVTWTAAMWGGDEALTLSSGAVGNESFTRVMVSRIL